MNKTVKLAVLLLLPLAAVNVAAAANTETFGPQDRALGKRAITGAEKAMARSRKRAEKGLCTKEESDDFCTKSEAALKTYLDKQVKEGTITPAERKALRR